MVEDGSTFVLTGYSYGFEIRQSLRPTAVAKRDPLTVRPFAEFGQVSDDLILKDPYL